MGKFYSNKKRVLFIKFDQGEEFLPVGYLLANGFEEDVEMIPTTTRENENGWGTSRPFGKQQYSITFSALQFNSAFSGGDFTKISYDRLKQVKRARQLIEWRLITTDLQFVDYGRGSVTELSEATEASGFMKYNATLMGYGKPEFGSEREVLLSVGADGRLLEDGRNRLLKV